MTERVSERYYRCYLIKDEHIMTHEEVFSRDDDTAIERATGPLFQVGARRRSVSDMPSMILCRHSHTRQSTRE
jgi:hypothetical protein